ncbi:MAG: ParB/Srx family N-terminal domain-containing protein [Chlamydiota bacterium]
MKIKKSLVVIFLLLSASVNGDLSVFQQKDIELILACEGGAAYIDISMIRPGQIRYARPNVNKKINKALKKLKVAKREGDGYRLLADNGRSSIPADKAVPVIISPFPTKPYVLVDGHHDVLAAIEMGAKTVPVKVIADLSNLDKAEFYREAARKGYIYYKALGGCDVESYPTSFEVLKADPYRWLVTILSRKCPCREADMENDSESEASQGSYAWRYPVFIKSDEKGEDLPFVEFIVADIIYNKLESLDLCQEVQDLTTDPSETLVEKIRQVLNNYLLAYPQSRIRLVSSPIDYT